MASTPVWLFEGFQTTDHWAGARAFAALIQGAPQAERTLLEVNKERFIAAYDAARHVDALSKVNDNTRIARRTNNRTAAAAALTVLGVQLPDLTNTADPQAKQAVDQALAAARQSLAQPNPSQSPPAAEPPAPLKDHAGSEPPVVPPPLTEPQVQNPPELAARFPPSSRSTIPRRPRYDLLTRDPQDLIDQKMSIWGTPSGQPQVAAPPEARQPEIRRAGDAPILAKPASQQPADVKAPDVRLPPSPPAAEPPERPGAEVSPPVTKPGEQGHANAGPKTQTWGQLVERIRSDEALKKAAEAQHVPVELLFARLQRAAISPNDRRYRQLMGRETADARRAYADIVGSLLPEGDPRREKIASAGDRFAPALGQASVMLARAVAGQQRAHNAHPMTPKVHIDGSLGPMTSNILAESSQRDQAVDLPKYVPTRAPQARAATP